MAERSQATPPPAEGMERGRLVVRANQSDTTKQVARVLYQSKKLRTSFEKLPSDAREAAAAATEPIEVDFYLRRGAAEGVLLPGSTAQRRLPPEPDPYPPRPLGPGEKTFRNPYGFVAKPTRQNAGPLADGDAPTRGRLHEDRLTGSLTVRLTVETPLLIADPSHAVVNDGRPHVPTTTRPTDSGDGKGREPFLPGSSLKGALRSAYEAVTAGRFGVFGQEHALPLAQRMPSQAALRMVPARVEITEGERRLRLLPGTSPIGSQHQPRNRQPLYGAWVPRYLRGGPRSDLEHGQPADVEICLVDRKGRHVWEVVDQGGQPIHGPLVGPGANLGTDRRTVRGWYFSSGRNFGKKHDERFFFDGRGGGETVLELTARLERSWASVIQSYRDAHTDDEIWKRNGANGEPWQWLGGAPGATAWSRHQWDRARPRKGQPDVTLRDGDLLYVYLHDDHREGDDVAESSIIGLFPVQIAREPFDASPAELATNGDVAPARTAAQLSAADRLFGWVSQDGGGSSGARASRLRIGRSHVVDSPQGGPVQEFADGFPLTILSSPKPHQPAFYTANGYQSKGRLAGAKLYHFHSDKTAEQVLQCARRTDDLEDSQNLTVRSVVRPGTSFEVRLDVLDVSRAELGSLTYVLTRPRLAIGHAKPLGWGWVRPEITSTRLGDGAQWASAWRLEDDVETDDSLLEACETEFRSALEELVGGSGSQRVLNGYEAAVDPQSAAPVHYPRNPATPDRDGENYGWFTQWRNEGGPPPLPPLDAEPVELPYKR